MIDGAGGDARVGTELCEPVDSSSMITKQNHQVPTHDAQCDLS